MNIGRILKVAEHIEKFVGQGGSWAVQPPTTGCEEGHNFIPTLCCILRQNTIGDGKLSNIRYSLNRHVPAAQIYRMPRGVEVSVRGAARDYLGITKYHADKLFKFTPVNDPFSGHRIHESKAMAAWVLRNFAKTGDVSWDDGQNMSLWEEGYRDYNNLVVGTIWQDEEKDLWQP